MLFDASALYGAGGHAGHDLAVEEDEDDDEYEEPATPQVAVPGSHVGARLALVPQRGTLLDRFLPALILGTLLFLFSQQGIQWISAPFSPSASADSSPTPIAGEPPAAPR